MKTKTKTVKIWGVVKPRRITLDEELQYNYTIDVRNPYMNLYGDAQLEFAQRWLEGLQPYTMDFTGDTYKNGPFHKAVEILTGEKEPSITDAAKDFTQSVKAKTPKTFYALGNQLAAKGAFDMKLEMPRRNSNYYMPTDGVKTMKHYDAVMKATDKVEEARISLVINHLSLANILRRFYTSTVWYFFLDEHVTAKTAEHLTTEELAALEIYFTRHGLNDPQEVSIKSGAAQDGHVWAIRFNGGLTLVDITR